MKDNNALKLPVKPDQNTLKLLLRAREMYLHAMEHASLANEFDSMIAILGLDCTIEYILRIVASHLELETITGKSFSIITL